MKTWMDRWAAGFIVCVFVFLIGAILWLGTIGLGWWFGPVIVGIVVIPWIVGVAGDWIFDYTEGKK